MKIDENLAAVHAYLCADGYVIKNDKFKYYRAGLRNTQLILLKDFQERFEKVFGVRPTIRKEGRCEKSSKEIYEKLTKEFGSFYSWEWQMPELDEDLMRIWLRAYFDCEGWVFCKKHQNRHIGADCVNESGLNQVILSLNTLGIQTIKKYNKKKNIYRILIYGKENLIKFKEKIGFLHPEKAKKLDESIKDYVVYIWNFPDDERECQGFIKEIFQEKVKLRRSKYLRIFSRERENLNRLSSLLKSYYNINCKVYRCINGLGTVYYELHINRKEEIQRLIDLNIIPNLFKLKTS